MRTFEFTFRDIDNPARTTVTTTEGLDDRWALRDAINQLQNTAGEYAWLLVSTEEVVDEAQPEEDHTA